MLQRDKLARLYGANRREAYGSSNAALQISAACNVSVAKQRSAAPS
jgi:hypothetical protein